MNEFCVSNAVLATLRYTECAIVFLFSSLHLSLSDVVAHVKLGLEILLAECGAISTGSFMIKWKKGLDIFRLRHTHFHRYKCILYICTISAYRPSSTYFFYHAKWVWILRSRRASVTGFFSLIFFFLLKKWDHLRIATLFYQKHLVMNAFWNKKLFTSHQKKITLQNVGDDTKSWAILVISF